jgi:AcrR family transcriptional regulator
VANGVLPSARVASGESPTANRKLRPGPGRSPDDVGAHQLARIYGAMIEATAEGGYESLTVRDVVQRAKVSTRAFYMHFESKEDCLLRTHEFVVRRTARRIVAAQAGERNWRERLRLAVRAFTQELACEPEAARLVLVEAYSAGPAARERARHAEYIFEAMITESFSRAPGGVVLPQPVVEGIVTGFEHVARMMVLDGRELELPRLADALVEWALCYRREAITMLAVERPSGPVQVAEKSTFAAQSRNGDRAALLSSVSKLAVAEGYERLTVGGICKVAGVSRRSFNRHFMGVEDCFLATVEERGHEAIACAGAFHARSSSWAGSVYCTVAGFCAQLATDPILARLLFVEPFAAGASVIARNEQLGAGWVGQLLGNVPLNARPAEPAAAASTGAALGLLGHWVAEGQARGTQQLAPALAYLMLAPAIGAEGAVAGITGAQDFIPVLSRENPVHRANQTGESQDAHA